jgi:hypothetical protein
MKEITIDGVKYPSISAAYRAYAVKGLPMVTVRKRLAAGWEAEDAFGFAPVLPQLRRNFKWVWRED